MEQIVRVWFYSGQSEKERDSLIKRKMNGLLKRYSNLYKIKSQGLFNTGNRKIADTREGKDASLIDADYYQFILRRKEEELCSGN
ncbi:hypothetical protein LAG90_08940 [Marinilongibacter aquaticus]|uniref:hypothetical protein n=1 Tax=Marinilongibacter aquaticus TaxID=2975157 RepID=UPI0021BD7541|nr:hypothetical protein [Marinilongibacter aquaticus]UBM60759.1 hypothetical protein LAG90_08940 [Marinilongibacter aquaticus]